MRRPLVVAVGDPAGIGPEISVRAVLETRRRDSFVLVGDGMRLRRRWQELTGTDELLPMIDAAEVEMADPGAVALVDIGPIPDEVVSRHAPSAEAGGWQLKALRAAMQLVERGRGRALITGPVSKEAISSAGVAFTGQTEFLAESSGLARDAVTMQFLGPKLRVGLVTTHLAIADVPAAITPRRVERAIEHLSASVRRLIPAPAAVRLAVCGLNPHAGEGGLLGEEDISIILESVHACEEKIWRQHEVKVLGPIPAETAFRWAAGAQVEAVVAMYHDQATIPSKILDFGAAVNVTWGLPYVRTSVDHGVAYDAARAGTAESAGMVAAIELAMRLAPADDGSDP